MKVHPCLWLFTVTVPFLHSAKQPLSLNPRITPQRPRCGRSWEPQEPPHRQTDQPPGPLSFSNPSCLLPPLLKTSPFSVTPHGSTTKISTLNHLPLPVNPSSFQAKAAVSWPAQSCLAPSLQQPAGQVGLQPLLAPSRWGLSPTGAELSGWSDAVNPSWGAWGRSQPRTFSALAQKGIRFILSTCGMSYPRIFQALSQLAAISLLTQSFV